MRYRDIIAESFAIPEVWYHSTELDPEIVAKDFAANNIDPTGAVKSGDEYWFSDDWEASRYYGDNTVRARLHMTNPLLVTREEFERTGRGPSSYWAARARAEGHDAVVINDIMDGDQFSTVCAVFSASQIEAVPHSKYNEETDGFDLYEGHNQLTEGAKKRWPERLDQAGLIEYVRSIAPRGELEDEDDDYILEILDHPDGAHLTTVRLDGLTFNGGYGEDSKVDRYAKRKSSPPPIIVNKRHVVDGNHRVKAALQNGLTELPAYILRWDDE